MSEERNRVLEGMQEWQTKEQNIADLFSPEATSTRYFQKLKLDQLHELSRSIKNPTKDEKIMLRILDGEIDRLERRLYPNLLVRILVHLERAIRNIFKTPDLMNDRTIWMTKPYLSTVPEHPKNEKKNAKENTLRPEQVYKQKVQKPELLEKKRVSQKKGLGM